MERAIDRTLYRRSNRQREHDNERMQEKEQEWEADDETIKEIKHFKIKNILLNQTIVSLLIILGVLVANYFDTEEVIDWIQKGFSGGYHATEIVRMIEEKWNQPSTPFMEMLVSGEEDGFHSGENSQIIVSGESLNSGDFLSAVEGINQMEEDVKIIKSLYTISSPLQGMITSLFGVRVSDNPIVSSYHTGLDIAADSGTEIKAICDGTVQLAKLYGTYGNCIIINNGELQVLYAHCSTILVKEGNIIQRGDTIAKVGMTGNATGPHLHLEIRYQERLVDPKLVL